MKKISFYLAVTLVLALLLSITCSSAGVIQVTAFSDVSRDYWGYDTIMNMTKKGLFTGTTTPANGIGTFEPEKTMTRAEFVTVAVRAIYPDEAQMISTQGSPWWQGFYAFALEKELLYYDELNYGDLNQPMSREEMAMVMVRCVENNGETLSKRVATSQIADYVQIGYYYKPFVVDCFSFGLLTGVDANGTFAPTKSLTRAEAATALYRLINQKMRVPVIFEAGVLEENTPEDVTEGNSGSIVRPSTGHRPGKDTNDHDDQQDHIIVPGVQNPNKPTEDGASLLPWDNGGKKPEAYTWAEFEALDAQFKDAFFEYFEDVNAFLEWKDRVQNNNTGDNSVEDERDELPWTNGGKLPDKYTWKEFQALTGNQQIAFQKWFESDEAFDAWMQAAKRTQEKNPWENGGKEPSAYTWREFLQLTSEQQIAFQNWFGSSAAFEEWMQAVNTTQNKNPWENGGKQPAEYTWKEFEALTGAQQIAFQNSFGSAAAFEAWMERAQATDSEYPWEMGDKQPDEYTWDEFESLTGAHQMAFQQWFGSAEAFEAWMEWAQGTGSANPWENGGKQPDEYSWEEFESLTATQQMVFQKWFDSPEAFEKWMLNAQGN